MAIFFKILFGHDLNIKLRIPPAFVRRHLHSTIPDTVNLLCHSHTRFVVTVIKLDGSYFLTDGWDDFVSANEILHREFLLFKHLDGNTFEVYPFGLNGVLKDGLGVGGASWPISGIPHKEEGQSSGSRRVRKVWTSKPKSVETPKRVWKAEPSAAVEPLPNRNNTFELVITESYLKKANLHVPKWFMKTWIQPKDQDVVQVGSQTWCITLKYISGISKFSAGGIAFVQGIGLEENDVCTFQLVGMNPVSFAATVRKARV